MVVIVTILEHRRLRFVEHGLGLNRHLFPECPMDTLIETIGLRMIRMGSYIGRADGVHELDPIVTDELRAAVMHDLRFAGEARAAFDTLFDELAQNMSDRITLDIESYDLFFASVAGEIILRDAGQRGQSDCC